MQAERPGGGLVAVKGLSLRSMADWKQLELFEREAAALRSLSHPGIPAYKDYFEVDSDGDRAYFLVQVSKAAVGYTCCMCMPLTASRLLAIEHVRRTIPASNAHVTAACNVYC